MSDDRCIVCREKFLPGEKRLTRARPNVTLGELFKDKSLFTKNVVGDVHVRCSGKEEEE